MVPTSNLYCVPMEQWEKHADKRPPTIPGTECILVNLSFWLDDVTVPEPLYDRERFLDDPNYAYHLANLNILTYLADHHDQRSGNILASVHEKDRHVYAIDNGITFGPPVYNWLPWPYKRNKTINKLKPSSPPLPATIVTSWITW